MASSAPKKTTAKKAAAKKKPAAKKAAQKKKPAAKKPAAKKPAATKKKVAEVAETFGVDIELVEDIAIEKVTELTDAAEKAIWNQVDKIQEEVSAKKKGLISKLFKFLKS